MSNMLRSIKHNVMHNKGIARESRRKRKIKALTYKWQLVRAFSNIARAAMFYEYLRACKPESLSKLPTNNSQTVATI